MERGTLSIEKRKFPRIPLEASVRFRRLSTDQERSEVANFAEAKTRDLSQGGIALVEASHLTRGDLLKIEIEVPQRKDPIKAFSEVMWIKPPDADQDATLEIAGIKFMGLRPEDEEFLAGLIGEAVGEGTEEDGEAERLSETDFIQKMGKRFNKQE